MSMNNVLHSTNTYAMLQIILGKEGIAQNMYDQKWMSPVHNQCSKYSNNDLICIVALSVESNIRPNIIVFKKKRNLAHTTQESKDGFGLGPSLM